MRSGIMGLLIGLAVGAGASYMLLGDRDAGRALPAPAASPRVIEGTARNAPSADRESAPTSLRPLLVSGLGIPEKAALIELAARSAMPALEGFVDEALAIGPSAARTFALETLLEAMGEIDPAETIEFARGRGIAAARLAPLFERWLDAQSVEALTAMQSIRNREELQSLASAVLALRGGDVETALWLLDELPRLADSEFAVRVAELEAGSDPHAAMQRALAMTDTQRKSSMLSAIARVWARESIDAVLLEADTITEPALRTQFLSSAFGALAEDDPDAVVRFFNRFAGTPQELNELGQIAAAALALQSPQAALTVADRMSGNTARILRRLAISRLAATDLPAARAYVDSMPPGEERRSFLSAVVSGLARQDPDAAIAWVDSFDPVERRNVMSSLFSGLTLTDPQRAIDIAMELVDDPSAGIMGVSMISSFMFSTSPGRTVDIDPGLVASRILEAANPSVTTRSALSTFVGRWADSDPAAAMEWLFTKGGDVDAQIFQNVATTLGQNNPELADQYMSRVPPAALDQWISGVASGYARNDPQAALAWIGRYRGQPVYEAGVASIAQTMARYDPAGAARALTVDTRSTNPRVASAAASIASQWTRTDAAAARSWATTLPAGTTRDGALLGILGAASGNGSSDRSLLSQFSSDESRQRAALTLAMRTANNGKEADAQAIIDEYVTDPVLLRQAEQTFERIRNNPGVISIF